ncbi:MAG TPA: hypothetical protein VG755_26325 [Nannocystaceae bacterium]|nr:hypothetical protein [Nannocystaceae bacterium]
MAAIGGLRPSFAVGWGHAVGRHLSIGVELETMLQRRGFWQLFALAQTLRVDAWPLAPMRRLHIGGGVAIVEQIFAYERSLLDVAIAPTVELGWCFVGRRGLFFDVSIGVRMPMRVHDEAVVCRGPRACPAIDERVQPRAIASLGYAF